MEEEGEEYNGFDKKVYVGVCYLYKTNEYFWFNLD